MGSSKKHKDKDRDRESKKKRKHRSRSRSRSPEKKKRRHKERSSPPVKDRNPDYVMPDPRDEFDARNYVRERDILPVKEPARESEKAETKGDGSSLSIEETNRLRAKLGLKPLDVPDNAGEDDEEAKIKKQGGVHAPAINLGQQKKSELIKERLATKKAKRQMESKLKKVKGLGDSDSEDEGAAAWVKKSRKQQQDKEMAEKRAKMLEEMDEEFGIGNLVEEEFKADRGKNYSSQDLKGLKVEHAIDKFTEGRGVILTLKDKGILDEDGDDVLVNVNIQDDERAEKNVENKKQKPDYKPYDEPQYDEYGMMKPSNMLSKYDEEIDGPKKESFSLGSRGSYDAAHEKRMAEIRQQLRAQGQTLQVAAPVLASEYMTKEEAEAATFKKTKKKVRKIRKKDKTLKADDLLPIPAEMTEGDYGSRSRGRGRVVEPEEGELPFDEAEDVMVKTEPETDAAFSTNLSAVPRVGLSAPLKMDIDDEDIDGPDEDLTGVALEEEQVQDELHSMLSKARRLKLKKERNTAPEAIAQIAQEIGDEEQQKLAGSNIILNSTSEFCRNLGEIPTYGLAGNREEDRDEILDMELELMEQRQRQEERDEQTGGWNEVDIDDNPVDIRVEDGSVLEEEPIASVGVGAALLLATKKGYLESEDPKKRPTMSKKALELQAQNYTIQDKRYEDLDEKNRKRERYQGGMITEFKDKDSYKPEVKLDYVDESGRQLSQKEAFRQLSHRFHGKGSGKKKTEKRSKKVDEELLMKRMSSTDTPLNTLSLLQDKQRSEQSPFIVLSGGSRGFTSNTIVKPS